MAASLLGPPAEQSVNHGFSQKIEEVTFFACAGLGDNSILADSPAANMREDCALRRTAKHLLRMQRWDRGGAYGLTCSHCSQGCVC